MSARPTRANRPTDPVGRILFAIGKSFRHFRRRTVLRSWPCCRDGQRRPVATCSPPRSPATTTSSAILCGCAVFAFLPYCQMTRGNVVVDFFTTDMRPGGKAALDAFGTLLYLLVAIVFTWRLYYGVLELRANRRSARQLQFLPLVDHSVRSLLHGRPDLRDRLHACLRDRRRCGACRRLSKSAADKVSDR